MNILVTWPKHCDYPLWRKWLRSNRFYFNDVVVVFSDHIQDVDYTNFIRSAMAIDNVKFIEPQAILSGQDWRSVAVNEGLKYIKNGEFVLFMEQDFLIVNNQMIPQIKDQLPNYDAIFYVDNGRIHPAFLLARKSAISKTSKDFGIIPGKGDHFKLFTDELLTQELDTITLKALGYLDEIDFVHMNGLSHNHHLLHTTGNPNYKPELFKAYLRECLSLKIELDPHWKDEIEKYVNG
jgi:hypothetical protein